MTLEELENTVLALSPEDLARFREWFLAHDAGVWDRQFEANAAGKLDDLADAAIRQHESGRSSP